MVNLFVTILLMRVIRKISINASIYIIFTNVLIKIVILSCIVNEEFKIFFIK